MAGRPSLRQVSNERVPQPGAVTTMSLHRFHTPHPNPALIRALGWVNDFGILPFVSRVHALHIPDADHARLRDAVTTPFVLCPNHPEFFTDWMIDKWLMSRYAPRAIAWADPEIVNGTGPAGRWFWLSNGLVAAVRGDDLERAFAYSAERVAEGAGALLHPEGEVNWDNETPGALRTGAIRIAERAAQLARRAVHLVPLAWFIRYRAGATAGLERELDYVEHRLGATTSRGGTPAARLGALFTFLLEREAAPWDIDIGPREGGFAARLGRGLDDALRRLLATWPQYEPPALPTDATDAARAWRAQVRRVRETPAEFRRQVGVIDRMLRLVPAGIHEPTLTQEQVGERIKRLRLDWLRGTLRDDVTRFVPRAAAPRDLFLRVGRLVAVGGPVEHAPTLAALSSGMRDALAAARQDGLDRLGAPITYSNPFLG